ncbi:OPT oligopeptide transporter protein-domain-containing protein [Gautieria morchelliformis]|nr:OPT oligopeptide transporter protein-domain-containing protein [Gautieria morchelliformis]
MDPVTHWEDKKLPGSEKDTASVEVTELERNQSISPEQEDFRVADYAQDVAVKVLSTQDDPSQPALTFRFWFLGLGLSAFGSVFKPQTVNVAQLFLLLVSYILGNFMAKVIPTRGWFRYLNPGPFNIKEHTGLVIMCSTASVSATASEIIAVDDLYYNNKLNPGLAIFMLFSSQLLGYGFAGFLREFLVFPTMTWWPTIITTANVFQALHFDGKVASTRVKMFWIVFGVVGVWEIVPQYIFPVLSGVSIACLVANGRGDAIRNIFGGASNNEGMGLLAGCFDWNYIGGSTLWIPLKTQLNFLGGYIFTYIFMTALYYGNVWKAKNFPFMSQALFFENGTQYDQTAILTNNAFDAEKYAQVGPAFFSASNALFLLVSNLALGSCLVHVFLWHWPAIRGAFTASNLRGRVTINDPHYEKMKAYKPVPTWWFLVIFAMAYTVAQVTNYKGDSGLPWWCLTVLLVMAFILTVLYGFLAAITGFSLSWFGTGFFQMIVAFMIPGKPIANMYGTLYAQHTMNQALGLLQDFKLGQYCKLPHRVTFIAQVCGAMVGAVLNYVMLINIVDNNRDALLSISGTRLWSGQNPQSYNSNAISWGALGPQMFGAGGTYVAVPLALAVGIVLPIPFWILHRKYPRAGFDWIITPIIAQVNIISPGRKPEGNDAFALVLRLAYSRYQFKYHHDCYYWIVHPILGAHEVSSMVRQVQVGHLTIVVEEIILTTVSLSYIVSGAIDGGTQVMVFFLVCCLFPISLRYRSSWNISHSLCLGQQEQVRDVQSTAIPLILHLQLARAFPTWVSGTSLESFQH